MWHHTTVECIPWHTKETITALKEICKESSCWCCLKCSGIVKKLNGRLAAIEKDVKEVKSDVEKIQITQTAFTADVRELRNDVSAIQESAGSGSAATSSEVLAEIKDREERKKNVIVLGVKESSATGKADIHTEENDLLSKLFRDMGVNDISASDDIKFKARLGAKEPGKKRPFLLKFHDSRLRDKVLRNTAKIKSPGVRIKPDLTKKQREEDDLLKKEVDDENKLNPKDESGDYRWKLAGPPGNMRKVKVRNIQEWETAQQARAAAQESRQ